MEPVIYSVNHIATSSLQLPDLIYIMNFTSKLLPALLQAWEHRAEHLCVFVAGKKHLFILVKCPALNTPRWLDTLVVTPAFSQNPGLPEKGRKSRQPKMPVLHPFLSKQLGMGAIWVLCWGWLQGAAHATPNLPSLPADSLQHHVAHSHFIHGINPLPISMQRLWTSEFSNAAQNTLKKGWK